MRYVIMYRYRDMEPEEIDEFDRSNTPEDRTVRDYANEMLAEYRLAMATPDTRVWMRGPLLKD